MHEKKDFLKIHFYSKLFSAGTLLFALLSSFSYAENPLLSGVKNEIHRQEVQLNSKAKKLNILQGSLKKQEQYINTIAKQIRNTKLNLSTLENEIATLSDESERLTQISQNQKKLLKDLLNRHYRHGSHGYLNTLLSGQDSSDIDRMTIYTEYLSKARAKAINDLSDTHEQILEKRQRLENQTKKQNTLLAKLQLDKNKLEIEQKKQKKTAKAFQYQIRGDKSYLTELKDNEKSLKIELAIAAEKSRTSVQQVNVKMDGLGKYKGRLQWPSIGKILHRYGSQQTGELSWNGMVISAKEGSEVKATHDGTIVLSNWLRGYGLMLVIDHGKGDMSFYGYNQALLRNVGDTVKAGDPIALAGNSGGQSSAGLYFEIRRKGKAINPDPWLK